jgi:two-component system sensor histidine kinase ChiS
MPGAGFFFYYNTLKLDLMYKERYLLSWMVHMNDLFRNDSGKINIFLTGFIAALLCLTVLPVFYRFFAFRKERPPDISYRIRLAAAAAVLCLILGGCLSLLPLPEADTLFAGSLIQSLGLIVFEIALFSSAFLPDHQSEPNNILLGSLAAAGFLGMALPLGLPLRSVYTLGCFSLFMGILSLTFVLLFRRRKYRSYLVSGIELLLLAASLFIPFPMPQFLIWTAVTVFFFSSDILFVPRKGMAGQNSAGDIGDILIQDRERAKENSGRKDTAETGGPAEKLAEEPEETILSEKINPPSSTINPFVPREFLDILNKETVMDLQLGDHTKQEMTIFFSDIRQFTDLSENLTPEESFKFINSYLSRIVPEITEKGGFVDKYIGDAILALYPQESGADMAVRTAIAIQKRILEYNIHRASCGYRPLSMGIGLHTGTLMLGVVGVEGRMQNTVISDAVNLASRLESITKFFNVSMAISEQTFKKLADPGAYMYRFIGKVRVKGKSEPVSVFEIFDGIKSDIMERKMKANTYFEQGMLSYYQKEFGEALINFRKVLDILPEDGASLFYMQNCLAKIKIAQL